MRSFILSTSSQAHIFLAEKRKDPLTGERFQENDEIVFCASCKSAFLKDSWEYMGGEHCGQLETLAVFPDLSHSKTALTFKEKRGDTIMAFPVETVEERRPLSEVKGLRFVGYIAGWLTNVALAIVGFVLYQEGLLSMFAVKAFAIFFISVTALTEALRGEKKKFLRNEFQKGGVLINEVFFPYQDVAECRISAGETDFRGTLFIKLHFFFHAKEKTEDLFISDISTIEEREKHLVDLLALSDKLRLVFSPYSLLEKETEVLQKEAQLKGHTYHTESLYHGFF